jgi:type IV pilus assembly protein PilW
MNVAMKLTATRQRGFSLVELMVAMTLSLLLMAGALSILYSSKTTYNENDRLARLQESGRTVVEMLLRDARPAGFMGCSRPLNGDEFSNGLNNSNLLLWNFGQPVFGFEATGGTWSPALDALLPNATPGSDVLVMRTTRQGQGVFRLRDPVVDTSMPIVVDADAGSTIPADTPMIIGDCEGSSVFMATAYNAGTGEISHAIAAGGGDGNTTANLTRGFVLGAQVMPIQTVAYFVAPSESGTGPSLWQRTGKAAPLELVDGVENMQVRYGVDTDNNLQADVYQDAKEVNDANNWSRVISIELAVLVRSPLETGATFDNREYDLLGTKIAPFNDRRQRAVFTTTVVLRNRTL